MGTGTLKPGEHFEAQRWTRRPDGKDPEPENAHPMGPSDSKSPGAKYLYQGPRALGAAGTPCAREGRPAMRLRTDSTRGDRLGVGSPYSPKARTRLRVGSPLPKHGPDSESGPPLSTLKARTRLRVGSPPSPKARTRLRVGSPRLPKSQKARTRLRVGSPGPMAPAREREPCSLRA